MPISKEDDQSSWEQYHIILLSHIVLVLTGPKVVIHKSLQGLREADLGCSSVATKEFWGRSRGPAKDTPMPKSA